MNNNNTKNPENITKHNYLILGRPASQLFFCLGAFIYYLYCAIIPIAYGLETNFPAEQDIHYSEGLFTYREAAGRSYQVGIKTESNTEFFSCKSNYLGRDICEIDIKYYNALTEDLERKNKRTNVVLAPILYKQWQEKPARIGWFWQKYSLFSTGKRVVQVIVDGKEVVPNENIKKDIARIKNGWIFDIAITSPILMVIFFLIRNLKFKQGEKHEQ